MQPHSTVLLIGVAMPSQSSSGLDVYAATTPREALATIRLVGLDLMVVGLDELGFDVWSFMERVAEAWPRLRWIFVSSDLTSEEEIQARMLGALMVLDAMPDAPWIARLAASLRQRNLAADCRPLQLAVADSAQLTASRAS